MKLDRGTCKGSNCNQTVLWCEIDGKPVPLNTEQVTGVYFNLGQPIKSRFFTLHHSTCPDVDQFRNTQQKAPTGQQRLL